MYNVEYIINIELIKIDWENDFKKSDFAKLAIAVHREMLIICISTVKCLSLLHYSLFNMLLKAM